MRCKLYEVCSKIVDGNHNPPKGLQYKTNYYMLSSQNIGINSLVNLDKVRYISKEQFCVENKRTNLEFNDILFTSVGTIGRSCIYRDNLNLCFQRSVTVIRTFINPFFLKYLLNLITRLFFLQLHIAL